MMHLWQLWYEHDVLLKSEKGIEFFVKSENVFKDIYCRDKYPLWYADDRNKLLASFG